MHVRKHALGEAYVVAAGVVIAVALLANAATAVGLGPAAVGLVLAGLVPAGALSLARVWLPHSGLSGEQIWTAAIWCGLGIGVVTLLNVAVLVAGQPAGPMAAVVLATSVGVGAGGGFLVGSLLTLRGTTRRLQRTNDVLTRVLRHNLGNDLTVLLGHLEELENEVPPDTRSRVNRLQRKVDEILTTTEKARQIDVALAARDSPRTPVDLVTEIDRSVTAVERAHPDATVTMDLPDQCWVRADWLLGSVVDNVVENAVIHARGEPTIHVSLCQVGDEIELSVVDDCPTLPSNERAAFERGVETPMEHSTGVGLRLVQLVVEGYGGSAHVEPVDGGGNELLIRLPRARYRGRLWRVHAFVASLSGGLASLRKVLGPR